MMMEKEESKEFASRWLSAWTGNKPEELTDYYSNDCFYLDAGIPDGANGKDELLTSASCLAKTPTGCGLKSKQYQWKAGS